MTDWSIRARARECQSCHKPFKNKDQVHTLLFEERQTYVRLDVCEGCWIAQHSHDSTQRKGFVSHWVSSYTPPPPPTAEPIKRESAEDLLRKLVQADPGKYPGACFILAVMLERRRILKARRQTIDHGRRIIVYEHAKTGEIFTVVDPGLKLDQLDLVQQEVARLLEHGVLEPEIRESGEFHSTEGAGGEPVSSNSGMVTVAPNLAEESAR
ncbi:MAG: hypothetical protein N3G20_04140 [Verrucomicrobiae bacterium]|nr:hypothetical protein [Verrucomicrobiae bacterium]